MVAKVLSLADARARKPCRRADGSAPARRPARAVRTPLDRAFAAVDALGPAAFEKKVEAFKRAWEQARLREPDDRDRRR